MSNKLADTQRAIIEAAERRGYERGLKDATPQSPAADEAVAWQFLGTTSLRGPFPQGEWKWCDDPDHARKNGFEVRPLYLRPQPATREGKE